MAEQDEYSIHTGEIRTFSVMDYVLFSVILSINGVIGLFYAFKDRQNVNAETFMLAGKSMSTIPVAMSLTVTFLSALTLLGNPSEVYNFDTMFWWQIGTVVFAIAGAAHVFIPFFYRLNITTVYEYIQMRFNTSVRLLGTFLIVMQMLVYFAFILYAPSLALSSVTDISLWGSVVGMGFIVTFYTTLGGMKAVVWTDTFQAIVIFVGLVAVLIRGCVVTGGFARAWDVASERGRIKFDDFSVDPSTRHSVWSVVIGGGFHWMSLYGVNQAQVQRCVSCPSVRKAQIALWVNLVGMLGIINLCFLIGIVMFAFYADCHPEGIISRRDQLLPLFVMDILSDFSGIPGIFVASIFSGSLSSLSSGMNALSSVVVKDLFLPFCCPRLSDFKTTLLTKAMVVACGATGVALAFLAGSMGRLLQDGVSAYWQVIRATVRQSGPLQNGDSRWVHQSLRKISMRQRGSEAAESTIGALNGPMFGLFLLGMFFPWANSFGAFVGCIASLVFMSWVAFGAFWYEVSTASMSPVITTGCTWNNNTWHNTTTAISLNSSSAYNTTVDSVAAAAASADPRDIPAYGLYTLSYWYYSILGAVVVVIVGLIASFISGHQKPSSLDPRLICPLFDILFPYLPECILKPLRFGVDHKGKYEKYEMKVKEITEIANQELKVNQDEGVNSSASLVLRQSATPDPVLFVSNSKKGPDTVTEEV